MSVKDGNTFDSLAAKIERLQKENAELRKTYNQLFDACAEEIRQKEVAQAAIAEVRKGLEKLSMFGEGTHGSRKCSSWDSLDDLQIEMEERMETARAALEEIDELLKANQNT